MYGNIVISIYSVSGEPGAAALNMGLLVLRTSLPWACLCAVFLGGGMNAAEVPSQLFRQEGQELIPWYYPDDELSRITALPDAVTPHIEWTKSPDARTLRVLAIAHKANGRWPIELLQRFAFEITTVYTHSADHLGARSTDNLHLPQCRIGQRPWDVEARILAAMNDPVDVIINDVKLEVLGEKIAGRLKALMARGVGYVGPSEGLDLAGFARAEDVEREVVHAAVPFHGLTEMTKTFESPAAAAGEIVKLWAGAESRVADLSGFVWEKSDVMDPERLQYAWLVDMQWETWCSLTGRTAYWAAGQKSVGMKVAWPTEPIERSSMPCRIVAGSEGDTTIFMRVWDADSRLRHQGEGSTIPQLPAGRYFVGLQQISDDRVSDWSFQTFEVTASTGIAAIELDNPHKHLDDTIHAVIALTGEPEAGSALQLEVLDNYGRSIALEKKPAAQRLEFKAALKESLHIYNYVNAILLDRDERPIAERRQAFYIRQPVPPHDDLTTMIWDPDGAPNIHRRILLDQFAQLGMRAALGERPLALANTHPVHWVLKLKGVGSDEAGVTSPNLASPDHISGTQAQMKGKAKEFEPFSPLFYYLGDDVRYLAYGQDGGFSPEARTSLAVWAKEIYGDIEALNQAWGTTYADFDGIEPVRHAEMLAALREADRPDYSRLCHWVDHQLHQDLVFSGFIRALGDAVNEVAPDTRSNVGSSVVGWAWPGSGIDFWKLTENKRLGMQYPNPWVHDIFRDSLAPDAFHGVWYGGYGLYNYAPYYFDQDYLPWWGLFHDVNLHGLYYGANSPAWGDDRILGADLAPLPGMAKIVANHNELKSGIAKLIFNAERVGDGIAILYSPTAIHTSTVFDKGLPMDPQWTGHDTRSDRYIYMQNWEGMNYLVRDLGFTTHVVPESLLSDGQFLDRDFRVLLMPFNVRLTDTEANTVRQFVEGGGIVIADALPGLFNGQCRFGHAGALADVFGVAFTDAPLPDYREDSQVEARIRREDASIDTVALPTVAVDTGIGLTDAKAMGSTESGVPIFTVNKYGQGTAILLNVLARDYQIWRTTAIEMGFRNALGRLLADAGVEPYPIKCVVNKGTDIEHGIQVTQIHRYELDGAQYVGLLRHAKLRPDDSVYMADLRPKPVTITFTRKGHVYEMRRGSYRGETDTIEDMIYPARAELYAVLPYEVRGLEISARADDQAIVVSGGIVTGTPDTQPGTHVVHVEITDPAGRLRRELTRNVIAVKGQFAERFFIGYNGPAGPWSIRVRDTASGLSRDTSVDL